MRRFVPDLRERVGLLLRAVLRREDDFFGEDRAVRLAERARAVLGLDFLFRLATKRITNYQCERAPRLPFETFLMPRFALLLCRR